MSRDDNRSPAGWTRSIAATAMLGLIGCYQGIELSGDEDDPGSGGSSGGAANRDPGVPSQCADEVELAPTPLVRLTQAEYRNSIRDLLDVEVDVPLPPDDIEGLFRSNSIGSVTLLHAERYAQAAEAVAAATPVDTLLSCPSSSIDLGCVEEFIGRFGRTIFRRPLTPAEVQAAQELYLAASADAAPTEAVRVLLEGFLQAPQFLYRVETVEEGAWRTLDDYELAARLSYFLWDTTPDTALLDAAEAGELSDPDALEAHARRMLESPRADDVLNDFHAQWLVPEHEDVSKNAEIFPEFDAEMYDAMRLETELVVSSFVRYGDGRLHSLFASDHSIVNDTLFELYGAEPPDDGWLPEEAVAALPDGFFPAKLPPGERAGILTHAGLLATLAKPDQSAPVERGVFVLERLMCVELPQPPPTVMADPPPFDPSKTTRELYRQHSDDPGCRGCHEIIDPIGFAFENYDAIGRFQTVDPGGNTVDASATVSLVMEAGEPAVEFEIDGAAELADLLADSAMLKECTTRQWYRYALSRQEASTGEDCVIDELREGLDAADGDIRELLIGIVTSPTFRHAVSN